MQAWFTFAYHSIPDWSWMHNKSYGMPGKIWFPVQYIPWHEAPTVRELFVCFPLNLEPQEQLFLPGKCIITPLILLP